MNSKVSASRSDRILLWLKRFTPMPLAINWRERIRVSVGALLGIAITGWLTAVVFPHSGALPLLIAPIGASAVLLFAVPASPLAQPWSLLGGNLVASIIGITCAQWITAPVTAAAIAVGATIGAMIALRCVHPPSGAVALTAVLGGPAVQAAGYSFALIPVGIDSTVLLVAALIYHNATGHRYPHANLKAKAATNANEAQRQGFTQADLDAALSAYNEILPIDRGDLEALLNGAQMHAYRRRFNAIACAEIMSHAPHTVEFGSPLQEAWTLLHRHRIKALPVIDRSRRVIGIVTQADFLRHAQLHTHKGLALRLRLLLRRIEALHRAEPEVVGQIMSTTVATANANQPIAELVPLFAASGHHHIPVVDGERRLVGILTQSDLVRALCTDTGTSLVKSTAPGSARRLAS